MAGVGTIDISNYEGYLQRMTRGLYDKLFFIDKVGNQINTILDVGCADGYLTQVMASVFNCRVIGYDLDAEMIATASAKYAEDTRLEFVSRFEDVPEISLVYASSLIHEVYSYGSPEDVQRFWQEIFARKPEYVVIRDMIGSETMDRDADKDDVRKVLRWAREHHMERYLNDFEQKNGSIRNQKNLVHFLLKHSYTDNWEREVRENYFPISIDDLYANIPLDYNIHYEDHNHLVYLRDLWNATFDIDVKDKTHIKIILKRES